MYYFRMKQSKEYKMSKKIWFLGDAVVDLLPSNDNQYLCCPGGAPANVAVGVARLGGKAAFIGRVGDDPFGKFMQQTLQKENIETQHLYLDTQYRTSTVIVSLDAQGERSFTFMVNPSADQFISIQDLPTFQSNEWLHCCSIALANEPSRSTTFEAMKRIKELDGYLSFDVNLRESLWHDQNEMYEIVMQAIKGADVLKFSEEELMFFMKKNNLQEALQDIATIYPQKLIIVTLGKNGTRYFYQNKTTDVPSIPIDVIDTTGAGDAFVGGLLAGLAELNNWQTQADLFPDIIFSANLCGALATTTKGAMSALPNRQQLKELQLTLAQ